MPIFQDDTYGSPQEAADAIATHWLRNAERDTTPDRRALLRDNAAPDLAMRAIEDFRLMEPVADDDVDRTWLETNDVRISDIEDAFKRLHAAQGSQS